MSRGLGDVYKRQQYTRQSGAAAKVFRYSAFSQNAHTESYFHILNYTPLPKKCQPFSQFYPVKFVFFVAMYRFALSVLCTMTYTFAPKSIFSDAFFVFSQSPAFFHTPFTEVWHTQLQQFLQYLPCFTTEHRFVLSIFAIFHNMITFRT